MSSIADLLPAMAPPWMVAAYAAFIGASLASFLCVVSERVPAKLSLGGRSTCVCGRQLAAANLVPAISWLASRGRAGCCGARIPARYVVAEVALGTAYAGLVFAPLPWPLAAMLAVVAAAALVATTWTRP
ncbi:MAG: prepilin peptidase [Actinomycetia bacterium]|nr:prepilin peptidase [Actinomycetes bacterium]MCP4845026.1 prepilin peptidase [Actinomycetes bacterium]